jgi:hypothetical protein
MVFRKNLSLFSKKERDRWEFYLLPLKDLLDEEIWTKENYPRIGQILHELDNNQLSIVRERYKLDKNLSAEQILTNKKVAIDLFCFLRFVELHISSIKTYLGLPNIHGLELTKVAFVKLLSLNDDDLKAILLYSIWRRYSVFERTYQLVEISDSQLNLFRQKIMRIGTLLSKSVEKYVLYERPYRLKMSGKFHNKYIYLFMRKKSDEEVLSFPSNKTQSRYTYKFVILDPVLKKFSIVVHTDTERRTILNYISKKIKFKILYDYNDAIITKDQVAKFFLSDKDKILLTGITYKNSKLPGGPKLILQGNPSLNPINSAVATLNPNYIEANDMANIRKFNILFEKQPVTINVDKVKDQLNLGYYRLRVPERGLTYESKEKLIKKFDHEFKIPLNKYFLFGEKEADYKTIINFILIQKHVSLSDKPLVYSQMLDKLYNIGLLDKPKEVNQRYCINQDCNRRYRTTWRRGYCICEKELVISGTSFGIKIKADYVANFIIHYLSSKNLKFAKANRVFNKRKRPVIEVFTEKGNITVIPVQSTKIDTSLLDYLKDNEINSLIVPYPTTVETQEIKQRKHGLVPVSELIYSELYTKEDLLTKEINETIDNSVDRVVNNYEYAISRYGKPGQYDFRAFEKDMYSILHYILPVAQRLGDDLIGKRVSDGIASLPLQKGNRFCITWDCKYTNGEYTFKEPYKKTVIYLEKLSKLPIVKTFGGLRTFIFISNNPSDKRFRKFSKRLIKNYNWHGKLILLRTDQLINLSKHFKTIRHNLNSSPEVRSKYYNNLAKLFYKPGRKIHLIRDDEITKITNENYEIPNLHITRQDV